MKRKKLFKLFNYFNLKYFRGELSVSDIVFADLKDAYGYTISESEGSAFVVVARGMGRKLTTCTLAHELIHVHQANIGLPVTHNNEFKVIAKKIAKGEGWKVKDI